MSCRDGNLGRVRDLLFDDESLTIRYLVARPGGIFSTRKILVGTEHLQPPEESRHGGTIPVDLTQRELKAGPPLQSDAPVSRRYEDEYRRFHSLTPYWSAFPLPSSPVASFQPATEEVERHQKKLGEIEECHLRSFREIIGYSLSVSDGDIGTVGDVIIDVSTWEIRYFVIEVGVWLLGRSVLIRSDWISNVDYPKQEIEANLSTDQVKNSPDFHPETPVNRSYEEVLCDYYGKPHYW